MGFLGDIFFHTDFGDYEVVYTIQEKNFYHREKTISTIVEAENASDAKEKVEKRLRKEGYTYIKIESANLVNRKNKSESNKEKRVSYNSNNSVDSDLDESKYRTWYVNKSSEDIAKQDEINSTNQQKNKKAIIISVIVFVSILAVVLLGFGIRAIIWNNKFNEQNAKYAAAEQSLVNYIDSNGVNHCYSYSRTDGSTGIIYTYSLKYKKDSLGYTFELSLQAEHDNVVERSWVPFVYSCFGMEYYSEVIIDGNKEYQFKYEGISLKHCPEISSYTGIKFKKSSNWDSSLNIYDYVPDCYTLLRAAISNTQEKLSAYDANIELWSF